ncbi:Acyl-[acyl-carrier-protein]--UDP-N-acetylglucosamine O-acyltransferase [Dissostichus eleginoides]|uniref:Acyl-[acyl-carrier-protein]--UDP-N-acetylglucosamine O-acyltransferase n=1 Tax=Dissostichus eleginoides TaxID=100907 RepID=A0AAD9FA62_DISEL|nr:Acyl-[acyl-carrier-protein]--UDP-N-acetylglucosamine O-acyltransferase [Dissostichus eleginoides]
MSSCITLLCALLLLLGLSVEASSGEGGTTSHSSDLSGPELRRIYNSPVFMAERLKRPLDGLSVRIGPISHSGVRVTLADGSQWLVHKGEDYGVSSDTVVVDARHMSSAWQVFQTCNFHGTKTVADLVAAGGTDYSFFFDNCLMATQRMMTQ